MCEICGLDEVEGGVEGRARPYAELGWILHAFYLNYAILKTSVFTIQMMKLLYV